MTIQVMKNKRAHYNPSFTLNHLQFSNISNDTTVTLEGKMLNEKFI